MCEDRLEAGSHYSRGAENHKRNQSELFRVHNGIDGGHIAPAHAVHALAPRLIIAL